MEEQTSEILFLVLGAVMFVMAFTLLLRYEREFFQTYETLYKAAGNEYIMPEEKWQENYDKELKDYKKFRKGKAN